MSQRVHNLHTLQHFALRWTLLDTLRAVQHETRLTTEQISEKMGTVPADPFDAKMAVVEWLRQNYGADAVDRVARLLRGHKDLNSALGDVGYTLASLRELLHGEVDLAQPPFADVLEYMRVTGDDQRRFCVNVWQRQPEVLARQIVLWRLQKYLVDEPVI